MAESSYRVIDEKSLDRKSWKVIGAGGFGQVYKARHLQQKSDVAIKLLCFDNGSNSDKYLLRECELMRRAESPHVIKVLAVFRGRLPSASGIQIGLVMELMERGSLASLQKKRNHPLPWSLVFGLAHQVSLGMEHLHSLTPPIIHKDLKPDNVLLDTDLNAKITDFGLSKFVNCSTSANSKGAGTTSYMPPEALISLAYKSIPAFDVYSYGILLCSIVKGKEPYETNPAIITLLIPMGQRPSMEEVDPEQAPGLEDLVKLMKRCWHQEPEERPLFPECTAVTEALYEKHKPGMKDAVHQVVTDLDAVDNWTSVETDARLASEKHFVDKHRRFLIKNVTAVDAILDLLLDEDIITNDDYENVRSKSTTQEMMRELYSFLKTSIDKDVFYQGLEEEEKLLLNELDGGVHDPQPNASSEPGPEEEEKLLLNELDGGVHDPQPNASSEPAEYVVRTLSREMLEMDHFLLELEKDPPNWRELASCDAVASLSRKETNRQEVINELFRTEHAHLRMLIVMQTVFSKPMEREEIFTINELATLFPNLDEIIEMHYTFYEHLKKLLVEDNYIVRSIGTTLLNRFGGTEGEWFQKLTARFCIHESWALDQIKSRQKRDPRYKAFILEAESKPQCRGLHLKDFIHIEFERLCKYPLLLENIAKMTEDQVEKESIQQSAEFCKKNLNHVNKEVKEVIENLLTLKDYQRRLDTSGLRLSNEIYTEYRNIDLTQKKLIYEGPLTWRVTKEKAIEVQCVLLSDLLVLLQKQDDKMLLKCQSKSNIAVQGGRQMFSPIIKLDSVFLREVATDRKAFYVIFTWDSGAQIYELVAPYVQECKGWTDMIKKAVDDLKKSRLH